MADEFTAEDFGGGTAVADEFTPADFQEQKATPEEFTAADFQPEQAAPVAPPIAIKPSPYEAADIASMEAGRGKAPTGMESGTELTTAMAGGAARALAAVPPTVQAIADFPSAFSGSVARAKGQTVDQPLVGEERAPQAREFGQWLQRPLVEIPKLDTSPEVEGFKRPGYEQVAREAVNLALSIPEFFESPLGIATMGIGGSGEAGATLVRRAFLGDMMKNLVQQYPEMISNWPKMTDAQKIKAVVDLSATAAMAGGLAKPEMAKVSAPFEARTAPEGPVSPEFAPTVSRAAPAPMVRAPQLPPMMVSPAPMTAPMPVSANRPEVAGDIMAGRRMTATPEQAAQIRAFQPRPVAPEAAKAPAPAEWTAEDIAKMQDIRARLSAAPDTASKLPIQNELIALQNKHGGTSPPEAPAPAEAAPISPHDLEPALLVDGKPVTGGEDHEAIMKKALQTASDPVAVMEAFNNDSKHVFVDKAGNIYDRAQAGKLLGEKEPLGSTRLRELQEKAPKPEAPKPAAPAPEAKAPAPAPVTPAKPRLPKTEKFLAKQAERQRVVQMKADAEEFRQLVIANAEQHGWTNRSDLLGALPPAGEQLGTLGIKGRVESTSERGKVFTQALKDLGITDQPNSQKLHAEALPKLKAFLAAHERLQPVPLQEMGEGSTFTILGEKFTVGEMDPETHQVRVVDGRPFKVDASGAVKIDPGSLKAKPVSTEFLPPEETPTPPKLRPGEKRTGELLQGADQPFNLAGQQGTDFERIAAEKAKAEKTKAEAAALAAKQQPQLIGMGGAAIGEVGTGEGADVMGVRQVTREKQAAAGLPVVDRPGQGISTDQSLLDGRAALAKDPAAADQVHEEFGRTGRFNERDFGIARAKYEQVMEQGRRIEEQHGTDSPEYVKARDEAYKWSDLTKRMQTEWHKSGMAQQRETDIDTGKVLDLETEHGRKSDRDFTPKERKRATRVAKINKQAQEAAGAIRRTFNDFIRRRTGTDAEKSAFDAANKTVREWAARRAEADAKSLAADQAQRDVEAKIMAVAEAKALGAANKVIRDAAVWAEKGEGRDVVRAADLAQQAAEASRKPGSTALQSANKTVRDAAIRAARAENKAAVDSAKRAKQAAVVERKAADKALAAAHKTVRDAAVRLAAKEQKLLNDPSLAVWTKAKDYLDSGGPDNFDDIRKKLATDLGMPIEQVTRLMAQDARAKYLADELWRRQQKERQLKESAKRWVQGLSTPLLNKALSSVPKILFGLKVGFHGTVALGTHAPTVLFQPRFWNAYVRDFGKMYRMVNPYKGKGKAYYENQIQDLMRRDNYLTARRAGLVNDPFVFEDYNSPDTAKYFGSLTGMGNRGYSVLKILRQDMFDQHWNRLPKSAQIPEVAQAIADAVNHATGVVQGRAPTGTSLALFAPRLEASRVMWLGGDPIRAVNTALHWNKASMGEKWFAMNQLKEKAWVLGTFTGLLALNQGFLSAVGSQQQVNVTDPFKPDFMKFKVAGMTVSYGNPMLTMARLPLRLFLNVKNEGKLNKVIYEDENVATTLFEYVRSQMSPFAGTLTDLGIGRDFMRKPLPRAAFGLLPGKKNMPKRLRAEGVQPYTWPEYASEQLAMIPLQEALKEVWGKDLAMDAAARERSLKALATIIVMGGTGARVSQDYSLKQQQTIPVR